MPRYIDFLGRDGNFYRAEQRGENNALPYIQKRIEYLMPVEMVDIEKVKQIIQNLKVNYNRDITVDEAKFILQLIKQKLIEQIEQLNKYYINKEDLKNEE